MEIDITHMMTDADDMPMLSGSAFELGDNAGKITWNNSKDYAKNHPFNFTDSQLDELRSYFKEFGAWDREEIEAWDREDLEALIAQDIASNIREITHYDTWEEYLAAVKTGTASGKIYKGDDGKFYFYAGG